MAFQSDLHATLTGSAGLAALIGTRLYPNESAQSPTLPFIVYYEFATPREQSLDGAIAVTKARIQYSIYAETYAQALGVADALRDALQASSYLVVYEDERANNDMVSGLERRDLDVRIVHVGS